jgi:hypothetical protein
MCRNVWWAALTGVIVTAPVATAQSVNMGRTFHDLEAQAERVVTTFSDAEVETRREASGAWKAALRDRQGRLHAELTGTRSHRAVGYRQARRTSDDLTFEVPEGTEVSLDWAATQVYALWTDERALTRDGRVFDPAEARWDGHVRRDGQALRRGPSAGQLSSRIQRVVTEFPDLTVTAALDQHTPVKAARKVYYSKFTARVVDRRTGRDKGFIRWFDEAQTLTWKLEGGGEGVVMATRLREGWTFTPTMAWAAVQARAFTSHQPHAADPGPWARLRELVRRPTSWPALGQVAWLGSFPNLSRPLPWQTPLVTAERGAAAVNEPGCDYLHWLDNTIFRRCCDAHDQCFEKHGCNASSWRWPFSGTWICAACNAAAVWCFCTAANPMWCTGGSSGGSGGSSGDNPDCTQPAGGFCPVECQTCISA